ncbi:hypothetical protein CB0940_02535 [Cercospora beticola]|uniref:Uncharacterized protein n=1 Tax=Cercospora beticola TaxID=122368 RepID=A0A2G5I4Y1_CERBT|nr:hypothetical protein CB0940_02535 [Cercospora beticola]PIA99864.1 hypothetical protein CB0940_02535 [Cercospora beticola]
MFSTSLLVSALLAIHTAAQTPPAYTTPTTTEQQFPITTTLHVSTSTNVTTTVTLLTTHSANSPGSTVQTQSPASYTSLTASPDNTSGTNSGGESTSGTQSESIIITISNGGTLTTTGILSTPAVTETVPSSPTTVPSESMVTSTAPADPHSQTTTLSSNGQGSETAATSSVPDSTASQSFQQTGTSFVTTTDSTGSSFQQTSTSPTTAGDPSGSSSGQPVITSSATTTESAGSLSSATSDSTESSSGQQTSTSFGTTADSATSPGDQQTSTTPPATSSSGFPSDDQTTTSGISTGTFTSSSQATSDTLPSTTQQGVQITLNPEWTITGDASGIVVGTSTLSPGGAGFTSGTVTISLAPGGVVVVDGSSTTLASSTTNPSTTNPSITNDSPTTSAEAGVQISVDPELTISEDASGIVIGTTTLLPGGPGFTSGTVSASLAPSGVVVVDGSTTTLPALSTGGQSSPAPSSQTDLPISGSPPSLTSRTSTPPAPLPSLPSPAPPTAPPQSPSLPPLQSSSTTAPPGFPTVPPFSALPSPTSSSTPDATDIKALVEIIVSLLRRTTPGLQDWVRGVDIDPKPIIEGLRTISHMAEETSKGITGGDRGGGCLDSLFGAFNCIIDIGTKAITSISRGVHAELQEILDTLIDITKILPELAKGSDKAPEEDPENEEQSSTSSCSAGTTTVSSCLVGCSVSLTSVANSQSFTTICSTTSCVTETCCDLEPTTTSSIIEPSDIACPLALPRLYNAPATYNSFGIAIPPWLTLPPVPDEPEPFTAAPASSQSAAQASSTTTSSLSFSYVPDSTTSYDPLTVSFSFVPDPTTSTSIAPSISATALPDFRDLKHLGDVTRKCYDPAKFRGHGDVHDGNVNMFADKVCKKFGDLELTPESKPFIHREQASGGDQINIDFVVSWIPGCRLRDGNGELVDKQKIDFKWYPEKENPHGVDWDASACIAIFMTNHAGCNNEGVGGSTDAGCLRYTTTGGRGEPIEDYMDDIVPTLPP